jgi:hypothetical protein
MHIHNQLVGPGCNDQGLFLHHLVVKDQTYLLKTRGEDHDLESICTPKIEIRCYHWINLIYRKIDLDKAGWPIINKVDLIIFMLPMFKRQTLCKQWIKRPSIGQLALLLV